MIVLISTFQKPVQEDLSPERAVLRKQLLDKHKALGHTDGTFRVVSPTQVEITFLSRQAAEAFAADAQIISNQFNQTVSFEYREE